MLHDSSHAETTTTKVVATRRQVAAGLVPVEAAGQDIEKVRGRLKNIPQPVANPVLVVVSGLPGTGKSHFCHKLAERAPFLIVESDEVRRILFDRPSYTSEESARVFAAIHALVGDYLSRGISVIADATNLLECHREILYSIAERHGARTIVVLVKAPPQIVRERLEAREKGLAAGTVSDADWSVYQKMKPTLEKIRRRHLVVDTSRDITPVIEKVLREINRR